MAAAFVLAGLLPQRAEAEVPVGAELHRTEMVRSALRVFGPDAAIADLAGQIHTESLWRCDARSRVGAQGCAQFMPLTAEDMARRFPAECAPANPFSPSWAFACRDRYMQSLLTATRSMTAEPLSDCELWWFGFKDYNGGGKWTRLQRAAAKAFLLDPNDPRVIEVFTVGRRTWSNHIENMQYPVRIFRRAHDYHAAGWGRTLACVPPTTRPAP